MPELVTAYIGTGSNQGDRRGQIEDAVAALARVPGIEVLAASPLHESVAEGGPPQGDFLNGAVAVRTTLSPQALFEVCKQLERGAGRLPGPPNHPRPLDLDLLLYGDQQVDTRELVLPHPRMMGRAFVIRPLAALGVAVDDLVSPARPVVLSTSAEVDGVRRRWQRGGCRVGLVPTMGALHAGHASLMRSARAECDRVIVSIFVNPLQFAPGEDLDRYPRTFAADLELLRGEGVDAVYVPDAGAMYTGGFCSEISVGAEARDMEGAVRAGHFGGVVTVVAKLLALTQPDVAYFGRKDAQQLAVVRRMAADLDFPLELRECPIVREADGLALSSRNRYLTAAQREAAPLLFAALEAVRALHRAGERDAGVLRAAGREVLVAEPLIEVDYFELRTEGSLLPLPSGPVDAARALVAARLGDVRLIDNAPVPGDVAGGD